jgi:hypothetical protein
LNPASRQRGGTHPPERRSVLACTRLRIDPYDGSPVVEYRIDNGRVEHRNIRAASQTGSQIEGHWYTLTPDEVASHVMASTVVAHWLARRLGVHALIRACNQHCSSVRYEIACGHHALDTDVSDGQGCITAS